MKLYSILDSSQLVTYYAWSSYSHSTTQDVEGEGPSKADKVISINKTWLDKKHIPPIFPPVLSPRPAILSFEFLFPQQLL